MLKGPSEKQTVAYNIKAREDFKRKTRARMGVWQAIELLNTLIDDSDPDVRVFISDHDSSVFRVADIDILCDQTSVGQIEHLLQTAEAIRKDGKPEWMQVSAITVVVVRCRRLLSFLSPLLESFSLGLSFLVP